MARAFECDRCGQLVKEADSSREIECKSFGQKYQNMIPVLYVSYSYHNSDHNSNDEKMDLCINCQINLLKEALEKLEKGKI